MTATLSRYTLTWINGTQWANEPELGSIYTDSMRIYSIDEAYYDVRFTVEDGRRLGLLFVEVESYDCDGYAYSRTYCLGQFHTNKGAKLFAQFAFNHFIDTETWSVCPSFEAVDYIGGEPYTLAGDEIVSKIVYG